MITSQPPMQKAGYLEDEGAVMQQLVAEHPEFPWPDLALAQINSVPFKTDKKKVQSYLRAFMKLCPKSP
jgi:hypothetical protein